jgi:hypothetical protein
MSSPATDRLFCRRLEAGSQPTCGVRRTWRVGMGESIYSAITSLDGYVADETGGFD